MLLCAKRRHYATRVINEPVTNSGSLQDVGKVPSGKPAPKLLGVTGFLAEFSFVVPVQNRPLCILHICSALIDGRGKFFFLTSPSC